MQAGCNPFQVNMQSHEYENAMLYVMMMGRGRLAVVPYISSGHL